MRLRNLLAAAAVSALVIGAAGVPAHSAAAPRPVNAGTLVTWSDVDADDPAPVVPDDLAGEVTSVAVSARATGAVTLDGGVRVWGAPEAAEVSEAPTGITDATTIVLDDDHGVVLRSDGRITAWGASEALAAVPSDLRATAIALQYGTGYAVRTDGTLAVWGDAPLYPLPSGELTNLVDVSATTTHVLALHTDGTVTSWGAGDPWNAYAVPDFGGKKVVEITTGPGASGVILEDGTIRTWGPSKPVGQPFFDGTSASMKVIDLSLGSRGVAVTANGAVIAWGPLNAYGDTPTSLAGKPVSAVARGQSHSVVIVTTFRDLTKPTVSGTPEVGQTLTATPATFSLTPDSPATGQWYADSAPIPGRTGATLALDASLVGTSISYRTTATRDDETLTSSSNSVGPVPPVPPVTSEPPITADPPAPPAAPPAVTVVITKAPSKTSGKAKVSGKTAQGAKKVTLMLAMTSVTGVSLAGKVSVTVKGLTKKVTVSVSAAGKATVVLKNVKRGKFTAKVKYAGNDSVIGSAASVRFKV